MGEELPSRVVAQPATKRWNPIGTEILPDNFSEPEENLSKSQRDELQLTRENDKWLRMLRHGNYNMD